MDPYYAVKLELDDLLQDIKQKMARYHGLQANNPERKLLLVQVESGCESAHLQVRGMYSAAVSAKFYSWCELPCRVPRQIAMFAKFQP